MKIKVSEATGAALDWLVAKCEGVEASFLLAMGYMAKRRPNPNEDEVEAHHAYEYSSQWACGGPIIEREKIELHPAGNIWSSDISRCYQEYGPTPLIAAMRCYVASKLGDEAEVPDESL